MADLLPASVLLGTATALRPGGVIYKASVRAKQTMMADFTPSPADGDIVQERVQQLTWALLDEHITDDELSLLENLLLSDDQARATYIGCVRLHTNLAGQFAAQRPPADTPPAKAPVLGFLNAVMPPLGFQSPVEDANR